MYQLLEEIVRNCYVCLADGTILHQIPERIPEGAVVTKDVTGNGYIYAPKNSACRLVFDVHPEFLQRIAINH